MNGSDVDFNIKTGDFTEVIKDFNSDRKCPAIPLHKSHFKLRSLYRDGLILCIYIVRGQGIFNHIHSPWAGDFQPYT